MATYIPEARPEIVTRVQDLLADLAAATDDPDVIAERLLAVDGPAEDNDPVRKYLRSRLSDDEVTLRIDSPLAVTVMDRRDSGLRHPRLPRARMPRRSVYVPVPRVVRIFWERWWDRDYWSSIENFDTQAQRAWASVDDTTNSSLVGVAEIARITDLSETTIRTYVARGTIVPPLPVAGSDALIWRRRDVEDWAGRQRPPGRPRKT